MLTMTVVSPSPKGTDHLTVAGLFAGIGGIELGLHRAQHETRFLCEIDRAAIRILKRGFRGFKGIRFEPDITKILDIRKLPRVDLVAAGFPCQDLSQAGRTAGILGEQSGLVGLG
jgi:DNA (cytosine-5)-methyltransferase 1